MRAALVAKGITQDEGHHHMYRKKVAGVIEVTRKSHDDREINNTLATRMAKQCCLYLAEFWQLIDCPLSERAWNDKIRERCVDGRNRFIGHRGGQWPAATTGNPAVDNARQAHG